MLAITMHAKAAKKILPRMDVLAVRSGKMQRENVGRRVIKPGGSGRDDQAPGVGINSAARNEEREAWKDWMLAAVAPPDLRTRSAKSSQRGVRGLQAGRSKPRGTRGMLLQNRWTCRSRRIDGTAGNPCHYDFSMVHCPGDVRSNELRSKGGSSRRYWPCTTPGVGIPPTCRSRSSRTRPLS